MTSSRNFHEPRTLADTQNDHLSWLGEVAESACRDADGTPVASFNSGQPVTTDRYALELNHPVPIPGATPRESLRVPAPREVKKGSDPNSPTHS